MARSRLTGSSRWVTDEAGDAWVVEVLWAAGRLARDRGAPDTAVRWLSRALAEGVLPVPTALLRDLGEATWLAGDPASALDHLRATATASAQAADDPDARAEIALLVARVRASMADVVGATAAIDAVLADRERLPAATVLRLEAEAATSGHRPPHHRARCPAQDRWQATS